MLMKRPIDRDVIKCFFAFFVEGLLIAPLRSGMFSIGPITGFYLSSIVGFVVIYFSMLYFLHKRDSLWIIVAGIVGLFFFSFPLHAFNFTETLVSLLENIIHFSAILGAYICNKIAKKKSQYIFSILIFMGVYVLSTSGYEMWIHYLNFCNLNGKVRKEKLSSIVYFQTINDSIANTNFEKELILLDFWNKTCGYCYEAFPKLQKLYDTYPKEKIEMYSVFVEARQNDNYMLGDSILKARNYSFPMLFLAKKSPAISLLRITHYPTIVILNKEGDVLFRGDIDNATKFINLALYND